MQIEVRETLRPAWMDKCPLVTKVLEQWFSTFLTLPPFNTVPHVLGPY